MLLTTNHHGYVMAKITVIIKDNDNVYFTIQFSRIFIKAHTARASLCYDIHTSYWLRARTLFCDSFNSVMALYLKLFATESTHVYSCIPTCTHVYQCIPMYTHVYRRIPMYTNVYPCILMYTHVYQCILMYTNVYSCIPMYTPVYPCITLYTHLYTYSILYIHNNVYSYTSILSNHLLHFVLNHATTVNSST